MNISIGQNWLNKKNPFEYIVPPPQVGRNKNKFLLKIAFILSYKNDQNKSYRQNLLSKQQCQIKMVSMIL